MSKTDTRSGAWMRECRASDCPVCGSDSLPVATAGDDGEVRRCVDSGHEYTAQAWVEMPFAEATRFN